MSRLQKIMAHRSGLGGKSVGIHVRKILVYCRNKFLITH